MRRVLPLALFAPAALAAQFTDAAAPSTPTPQRQQALVRLVRQDCGSCHGMTLTGGLGPPLTRQALAERSLDSIVATTLYGRPGTPMPPWRSMLSDGDAQWIAQQLLAGFPAEGPAR
jgi:cytochrome c55X